MYGLYDLQLVFTGGESCSIYAPGIIYIYIYITWMNMTDATGGVGPSFLSSTCVKTDISSETRFMKKKKTPFA